LDAIQINGKNKKKRQPQATLASIIKEATIEEQEDNIKESIN
jgi:hypothetical protein